ncbi:hypothetical protein QYE76_030227 [Lolium multiflorum]|uniref:RING-type E3 ubiquitin transferase n=1 Tax=Lolium multiflorum TaxID=4521 RepID=A0AAD8QSP7_LOLMU|nr:hypothetical protein QYE76_030227 [Lolium multiflorum]
MYHFSSGSQQPEAKADRRMFMRRGGRRFSSSSSSAASLPEIAEVAAIPRDEPLVKRSGFGPFAVRIQVANPVPAVPRNILDDNHGAGKLYVAVGEDAEDGKSNLIWAARNFLRAGHPKLVLLHVHRPAHGIMTGLCKVSARQQHEKELKAYRKIGKEESNTPLNQYLDFCRVSFKIQAETLVIEKNSPANGIIELIGQNHITSLVMGTSSFSPYVHIANPTV